MNLIRTVVSGHRNRYKDGEFDLDLSYITSRIIAMAYPSTGYESVYRNNILDVSRFLNSRHGENYMVFNLSERHYDNSLFGHRVLELGFPDHHAPPVEVVWTLCRTIDAWLSAAPENVAVVHCLAGKGRTGVIIACYLLFSGYVFKNPNDTIHAVVSTGPNKLRSASDLAAYALPASMALMPYTVSYGALSSVRSAVHSTPVTQSASLAALSPAPAEPAPAARLGFRFGSFAKSDSAARSAIRGKPEEPKVAVTPPHHMTKEVLALFRSRRGEGVKYPSQERTVRYFARVVHDALIAEDEALGDVTSSAAADENQIPRLQAAMEKLMLVTDIRTTSYVRFETVRQLRRLTQLPLPKRTPVVLNKIIFNGVPDPGGTGFTPLLQISTAPYQGADTKVIYNSAWHNPVPETYTKADDTIVFEMRAVIKGDILLTCCQLPEMKELFRFSFHTTFMTLDGVLNVYRLSRADIDIEKRKRNEPMFPRDFFLDIIYTVLAHDDEGEASLPRERTHRVNSPVTSTSTPSSGNASPSLADANPNRRSAELARPRVDSPMEDGRGGARLANAIVGAASPTGGSSPLPLQATRKTNPSGKAGEGNGVEVEEVAFGRDTGVVRAGWLIKRGKVVKNWKRRWFVLRQSPSAHANSVSPASTGPTRSRSAPDSEAFKASFQTALLYYYQSPTDAVPKGVIPLTATIIRRIHTMSLSKGTDPQHKTGGRDNVFAIRRDGRTHYLQAADEDDLKRWLAAFASIGADAVATSTISSPEGGSRSDEEIGDSDAD